MEYTAPYTPQMNGAVERRITVQRRKSCYIANFKKETRNKLWTETMSYTKTVRNSVATSRNAKNTNQCTFLREETIIPVPNG